MFMEECVYDHEFGTTEIFCRRESFERDAKGNHLSEKVFAAGTGKTDVQCPDCSNPDGFPDFSCLPV